MADIRCPACGRDNPDFLDVCQFCQTPLKSDTSLQIGQSPTVKNTGELEPILPDWLRDVRKQARESAEEEELPGSTTKPRIQKNDAPDLLAGLASSQSEEDDDIPDWLANINPVGKPKPSEAPKPEPSNDFFAQFNAKPAPPKSNEPPKEDLSAWMAEPAPAKPEQPAQKDDLSEWFSNAPTGQNESFSFEPDKPLDFSPNIPGTSVPAQPASEEKEDLSWLRELEASARKSEEQPKQDAGWNVSASSTPASQDDLGWLNNLGGASAPAQPSQEEDLSWLNALGGTPEPDQPAASKEPPQEDLSWLDSLGGVSTPSQPEPSQPSQQEDLGWLNALGGTAEPAQPVSSQSSQQEDLSWLNNLGGTSEPEQPAQEDMSWLNNLGGTPIPAEPVQPTLPQTSSEDLSWLDTLGGVSESSKPASESAPVSPQDDLGWLQEFGGASQPAQEAPAAQDDLSWLNALGGTSEPEQPAAAVPEGQPDWLANLGGTPTPAEPESTSSSDELDWLKNFAAATSEPSQPATAEPIELGWLDNLGGTTEPAKPAPTEPAPAQREPDWLSSLDKSTLAGYVSAKPFGTTEELNPPLPDETERVSPFVPRKTAPLGDTFNDDMPDWLRSATEETSDLPLGASALEQFRDMPSKSTEETVPPKPAPDTVGADVFSTAGRPFSGQDVDSLFSVDMPDWLTKSQPESGDISSQKAETPVRDDSLSPVELPSWVQAMRPVESVLAETGASIETQPTEKEGPLAGLRGVIPSAPIGSSRRPKAISLKLQASDEQQAGAALFDQILAGETMPRALPAASDVASQKWLRWTIFGTLALILSIILMARSQFMPVSSALPGDVTSAINAINAIPNNKSVLVVVDYEPSLAGEMEAAGAPVLNQIVLAHQPKLALLATSPESTGLIERLLTNAHVTSTDQNGFGYTSGNQYVHLGFLPGGTAGILGFVTKPNHVIQSAAVEFSEYSAVLLLTDNSESGRAWIEQLNVTNQTVPVILVTSAQTGPMLQPYVSSKQAAGLVNGLADAARFEFANAIPESNRIARTYWDAFGVGILLAIVLIIVGSVWSLISGFRARRASGEQG